MHETKFLRERVPREIEKLLHLDRDKREGVEESNRARKRVTK